MPTVTLLEKAYGSQRPETFEPIFSSLCGGFKIRIRVVDATNRGWIRLEVSGEDVTIALRFLDQKFGLAPVSLYKLRKFSVIRGKILSSVEDKSELQVDIGVFSPKTCDAVIPLQRLQAQLANEEVLTFQQLTELFCLYEKLPLSVKIVNNIDVQKEKVEAELSEAQLSQTTHWIRSCLDRLIVLGAPFSEVEDALGRSKHSRDVVKVEQLGLLEHAVVCKLGTDAVGLIPKLGPLLPNADLSPFCPTKIQKFVNRSFL